MPDPTEPPSFHVRMPASLQKRLKVAAAQSERSMNAEIVARLEQSFDLTDAERAEIKALLAQAIAVLG